MTFENQSMFQSMFMTVRLHVAPHRHSILLAAIIAAFAIRPLIGDAGASTAVFSLSMIALLLVALYNINVDELVGERGRLLTQSHRRRRIGWVLAAAAASDRIVIMFSDNRTLGLAGLICWFLFFLFVTFSELRSLLKHREVTGETICMAISVYLLMGFTWTILFMIMVQRHPNCFAGMGELSSGELPAISRVIPVLGYFSLTTLSTLGFGDITPLTLQARYAAVAEGITGQFYMAILVARLVSLQMSHSAGQRLDGGSRAAAD